MCMHVTDTLCVGVRVRVMRVLVCVTVTEDGWCIMQHGSSFLSPHRVSINIQDCCLFGQRDHSPTYTHLKRRLHLLYCVTAVKTCVQALAPQDEYHRLSSTRRIIYRRAENLSLFLFLCLFPSKLRSIGGDQLSHLVSLTNAHHSRSLTQQVSPLTRYVREGKKKKKHQISINITRRQLEQMINEVKGTYPCLSCKYPAMWKPQ